MPRAALPFLLLAALLLAACGDTAQERMISGGLIGAGAGALLGGITTPSPAQRDWHEPPPVRWRNRAWRHRY